MHIPKPPHGIARRTALVTGSSSGIGIAIARTLGSMGFNVGLTKMPQETSEYLDPLTKQLREVYGVECEVFITDLQVPETAAPKLMAEHIARFGRIDVLCNNAGWASHAGKRFMDLADDSAGLLKLVRSGFAVNYEAAVALSFEAVRHFRRQSPPDDRESPRNADDPDLEAGFYTSKWGTGRIINTNSVHGFTPLPKSSIYTMAKHALRGLTVFLAAELGAEGVTVNGVAPGMVATPQTEIEPNNVDNIPLPGIYTPRPGLPNEVAALVGFLASIGGAYTTAQTIKVDGGFCNTNPQYLWRKDL